MNDRTRRLNAVPTLATLTALLWCWGAAAQLAAQPPPFAAGAAGAAHIQSDTGGEETGASGADSWDIAAWDDTTVPGPSFAELISLRRLGSPAIAPDGSAVAYTVRTVDWANNRYDTEIHLARLGDPEAAGDGGADGEPFQLTRTAEGSSTSPRWSPDSRWLAFLADRGDGRQIHLIRPGGGEAQAISDIEGGVADFRWAPDGGSLIILRSEEESAEDKQREERYGAYAVEDQEYRHQHLWRLEVVADPTPAPAEILCPPDPDDEDGEDDGGDGDGGEDGASGSGSGEGEPECPPRPQPQRLTEGDFTVGSFDISPDGSTVAFERLSDPLITSFVTGDIWLLDLASGETTPLIAEPTADGAPMFSPDGDRLLYQSGPEDLSSVFYDNGHIFLLPLERRPDGGIAGAAGPPVEVAADFDEQPRGMTWTPTGIYFAAFQGTERHLYRLDPELAAAGGDAITQVSDGSQRVYSFDLTADGRRLAFTGETATSLTELYSGGAAPFAARRITDLSAQIAGWPLGSREAISWRSRDGLTIEGVLHKPEGFEPGRKYPLLVVIHGGPTGIDVPQPPVGSIYPVAQWLEKGALVLEPNYRGSAGYGEAFRAANVRNLGVGDAWDVLSGVDHLIEQGLVDPQRMGAMGWSQGGYISAFLTTATDRFRAISVGAGISDWMTYYVNTDIHPFTRQYLKATPWEDPEIYALTSPMSRINDAVTPTLIQHGEFDRRVPIPNAYQLYQGLQDVGVPARLIVYKGFGHGISKPKERLAATWHNWEWFLRYIWDE